MITITLKRYNWLLLILRLPAELEFLNSSGQVEISAGQSRVCLSVFPIDDSIVEDNQTFSIVLQNTSDSALILPQKSLNITILNDDCKKNYVAMLYAVIATVVNKLMIIINYAQRIIALTYVKLDAVFFLQMLL